MQGRLTLATFSPELLKAQEGLHSNMDQDDDAGDILSLRVAGRC